jgi:hypothetical protein
VALERRRAARYKSTQLTDNQAKIQSTDMTKLRLNLHPSEATVVQSAAAIYAAYISAGRVPEGQEQSWIERSIREAVLVARLTDEAVHSDTELG